MNKKLIFSLYWSWKKNEKLLQFLCFDGYMICLSANGAKEHKEEKKNIL